MLLVQWLPESARYDVAQGRMDRALETLQRIAKDNGRPMPLGRLVEADSKVCHVSPFKAMPIRLALANGLFKECVCIVDTLSISAPVFFCIFFREEVLSEDN